MKEAIRGILEGWARACPSNFVYHTITITEKDNRITGRIALRKSLSVDKKTLLRAAIRDIRRELPLDIQIEKDQVMLTTLELSNRLRRAGAPKQSKR